MAHIIDHSIRVCQVALFLSDRLADGGIRLDRDLIRASALLHDITKTRSLQTGEKHAESGGEFMAELGYPEIGDIVRQHVALDVHFVSDIPCEAEIVNYADKRVLHDRIVGLDERMAYIVERYGNGEAHLIGRLRFLWEKAKEMETRIFPNTGLTPSDLPDRMNTDAILRDMDQFDLERMIVREDI